MTFKQLRARIDRVERLVKSNEAKVAERKLPFEFPIDPALAKALRDDHKRVAELQNARPMLSQINDTDVTEEERMLRQRIAERANTISCPAGYGFKERWDDLESYSIEDVGAEEEAQLIARIAAFDQSPEGRARARIKSLTFMHSLSSAEESELDRLLTLYPEPWCHPNDPMRDQLAAWGAACIKYRREW